MKARLFTTVTDRPQTAYTFELLDTCEELALQGKTNIFDMYNAFVNKSDKSKKAEIVSFLPSLRSSCLSNTPL